MEQYRSMMALVLLATPRASWVGSHSLGGIRMTGRRVFTILLLLVLALPFGAAASELHVRGDRVSLFGDVEIAQNWRITGNAVAVFGNVTVYGQVDKSAVSVFGTVRVGSAGVVGRSAVAIFGRVITEDGGRVEGSQVSVLGGEMINLRGLSLRTLGDSMSAISAIFKPAFDAGRRVVYLILALITATIVALLFPDALQRVKVGIVDESALSGLIGLVAYLAAAPIMVILVITIVGIPLALLLGLVLWVGRALGYTAIALFIGERLLGERVQDEKPLVPILVGVLALAVVTAIPLTGLFLSLVISVVALGGSLHRGFGVARKTP